jgi:hypothetical protein
VIGVEHDDEINVAWNVFVSHEAAINDDRYHQASSLCFPNERFQPVKKPATRIGPLKLPESLANLRESTVMDAFGKPSAVRAGIGIAIFSRT